MPLPKQVQAQIDAADAMLNPQAAPTPAPAPEPQVQPVEPAPEPTPAPAPAPEPTPAPAPEDDAKYRVLKGKYDSEVPLLHQQNRDLNQRVTQLTELLSRIQQRPADQQPTPQAPTGATAKDIDDFGGEMVAMVQRVVAGAMAQIETRFASEVTKIQQVIGQVGQKQQLTAQQQFAKDLNEAVPDWAAIDKQPEWLEWLGQADPLTGYVRQVILDNAHTALDAGRVAAIFNAYKATRPAPAPAPVAAPAEVATPLAKQVAPTKASATVTPPAPATSVWTDAAIQAFYKDVSLGKFKGRDAEMQRIEADLNAAIAEGRYRPR